MNPRRRNQAIEPSSIPAKLTNTTSGAPRRAAKNVARKIIPCAMATAPAAEMILAEIGGQATNPATRTFLLGQRCMGLTSKSVALKIRSKCLLVYVGEQKKLDVNLFDDAVGNDIYSLCAEA